MTSVDHIAALAREHGRTVAVAESLTSGLIASELGKGESSSEWFSGGVVAYRTEVKEQVLGMEPGLDPCSAACAEQIARGVRTLLGSDVAVSATGVGGPDPQDGHRPGTVYLGWASDSSVGHQLLEIDGDPARVVERTTEAALHLLLDLLERRAGSDDRRAQPSAARA